eukprot:TRINITY_DN38589_c0_g1_i1.p1 TRINITY_DN38589_c0_g1~~TRINITY_DN38589_c0_g1_i1.p1  ORF type:complete len:169 (+),score=65.34 TRINITY_DN38589_c0_g1_i1:201-707(+)
MNSDHEREGGSAEGDDNWKKYPEAYRTPPVEPEEAAGSSINLEETYSVVKERVWYLGDAALKSVAEVLVGFGISPTVLGYSEEELFEEYEDEGGAQLPIQKDEVVANTSFSRQSQENMMSRRRAEDGSGGEEAQATDAALDEVRPQISGNWGSSDSLAGDAGEDKKDK